MTIIATEQRLLAPIYASAAVLRQYRGPTDSRRYAYVTGVGMFYWAPNSTATDDGTTIITPTGQTTGRWLIADPVFSSASSTLLATHTTQIAALEEPAQTVHTADGALVFGRVNILTSAADGMTIPDVATNAGEYMVVVNAMASTTAVLTRSGSDVVVNGTSATAYSLMPGESCRITAAATGTNVYIEHGPVPVSESLTLPLVIDRDAAIVDSGSGTLVLALAASGHVDNKTKTLRIPANQRTGVIEAGDLNVSGDAFDVTHDMLYVFSRISSRCKTALYDLGLVDSAAPTVVSAEVVLGVSATSLVVTFSEEVYCASLTGLSLSFTVGTARTITALASGNGTTILTFTLSGAISSGDTFTFVYGGTNTIQDMDGPALASSSTAVTVSSGFTPLGLTSLTFFADHSSITVSGSDVTAWPDQSGGANTFTGSGGSYPTKVVGGGPGGKDYIDFNHATSQKLETANVLTDFMTASAGHMFIVFWADSVQSNSATVHQNDALVGWSSSLGGIFLRNNGPTILADNYSSAADFTAESVTTGAWHVFQWWHSGGTLYGQLDSNAAQSIASGNSLGTGSTMKLGSGYAGVQNDFNGRMLMFGTRSVAPGGTDVADLVAYAQTEYSTP